MLRPSTKITPIWRLLRLAFISLFGMGILVLVWDYVAYGHDISWPFIIVTGIIGGLFADDHIERHS